MTEISDGIIVNLRKNIARYEEVVNKCNIYETNVIADSIGSDMDYINIKYANKTTKEQKQEIDKLEKQFSGYMNNLRRCLCVKKMVK